MKKLKLIEIETHKQDHLASWNKNLTYRNKLVWLKKRMLYQTKSYNNIMGWINKKLIKCAVYNALLILH